MLRAVFDVHFIQMKPLNASIPILHRMLAYFVLALSVFLALGLCD
jgi:hypothetical protein